MKREGRQHGHVRAYYVSNDPEAQGARSKIPDKRIVTLATAGLFQRVDSTKPPSHSKFTGNRRRFGKPPLVRFHRLGKKPYKRVVPSATAGLFHRVDPTKPPSHSKFTGKCRGARCRGCHLHPVRKCKTKAKGHHKGRCRDVVTNHRMYAWRAVHNQPPWAVGRDGFKCFGESAAGLIAFVNGSDNDYYYFDGPDDSILDGGDGTEESELSLDFLGKAQITDSSTSLEAGAAVTESVKLFKSSSSDYGSSAAEILSEGEDDDDDDWFFVDEVGEEEN